MVQFTPSPFWVCPQHLDVSEIIKQFSPWPVAEFPQLLQNDLFGKELAMKTNAPTVLSTTTHRCMRSCRNWTTVAQGINTFAADCEVWPNQFYARYKLSDLLVYQAGA
jgi:hypothetical protein